MSELGAERGEALLAALRRPGRDVTAIRAARRLTGGASAETWSVDVDARDDTPSALILRRAFPGIERFDGANSKLVEAAAQSCGRDAGVPAARVLAVFDEPATLGEGYVMERLEGETIPRKLLRDPRFADVRARMPARLGATLARLHRADFASVHGLVAESTREQLAKLERFYRSVSAQRPVFEAALAALHQRMPTDVAPALVHGDFRNGNLLVDERDLVAVLDWELAHVGDPMEDLGFLCANAWRFGETHAAVGGFGPRAALFDAYEAEGGSRIDRERVRYWELFGTFKWGVVCLFQVHAFTSGKTRSLERAAIGRRLAEVDVDLLDLLDTLGEPA